MAIEGGPDADGDRHAIIVDRDSCTLYELFDLHPAWEAGSRGDLEPIGRLAIRAPRPPDCPVEPIPPLAYVLEMSINPQERGLPAVVLVGGQGTRLSPLTEQAPKPMLPLLGRPLLAYTFDQLKAGGVERAILSCGYLPDEIEEYFGDSFDGLELDYRVEPEPRGTGGGIRFAVDGIAFTLRSGSDRQGRSGHRIPRTPHSKRSTRT
ncbi:MAG: nucleotidyltransferase family protein [Gaiellaceae bacterium]